MHPSKLLILLSIAIGSTLLAGGMAPVTAAVAAEPEFAIRNALRPGAKAPHCPEEGATPDGCIFHTLTNHVNRARLPLSSGTSWAVKSPDAALLTIRQAGEETAADGSRYQVIEIVPHAPEDADITITFDKLTSTDGPLRVIERRRVTMMKHGEKSWNES